MAITFPVIDFATFGEEPDEVAAQVGKAMRELGFLHVRNLPSITPDDVATLFDISNEFFASPQAEKESAVFDSQGRGFTKFQAQNLGGKTQKAGDFKESFSLTGDFGTQHLPPSLAAREDELKELYDKVREGAQTILECLARYLKLDKDFFRRLHTERRNTIRMIDYPTMPFSALQEGDIRAGSHQDWGSVTLLLVPKGAVPGLEIKLSDGTWLAAPREEDTILVNAGQMMEMWTQAQIKGTWHRVVFPEKEFPEQEMIPQRTSVVFFTSPDASTKLHLIGENGQVDTSVDAITAGEHVAKRLRETYQ